MKRIFFYTSTAQTFRTTMIGYLYEVAQDHEVVLMSELLDHETQVVLRDKNLFPGLEKIISVNQYHPDDESIRARNRRIYEVAKAEFSEVNPDIVIASSDVHSLYEMYLMRMAKECGALRITIQGNMTGEMKALALWYDLASMHLRTPEYLPLAIRSLLVKFRKYFGYLVYHWALPLSVGETPFFGKASYILHKGHTGMRDSSYHIVFSQRQYDFYVASEVPKEKLHIIAHPLLRHSRYIFERAYLQKARKVKKSGQLVTVMLTSDVVGFEKNADYSVIPKRKRIKLYADLISTLEEILHEWKIIIKPHPGHTSIAEVREKLPMLSSRIEVVDPKAPVDYYIQISDAIVDLPRSSSTTVYSALIQCPGKPVLSIDIFQEFLGDYYASCPYVTYVDSMQKFRNTLVQLRDGKIRTGLIRNAIDKKGQFGSISELINGFKN